MKSALVSQFSEITACESQAHAVRQLSSCQWNLEEAINLFFAAGGVVAGPSDAAPSPPVEEEVVRAPIPTRVERLCDDSYYGISRTDRAARSMWDAPSPKRNKCDKIEVSGWGKAEPGNGSDAQEKKFNSSQEAHDGVQGDDHGSFGGYGTGSDEEQDVDDEEEYEEQDNASDNMEDDYGLETDEDDDYHDSLLEDDEEDMPRPPSLAQMYRLPYELMFRGTFHNAKVHAAMQDRFLLVNLQAQDFASCLHNRDLWPNSVVGQTVKDNFVFLLLTKLKDYGDEGTKVCSFYKIQDDQLPAVLVLDPITGQMLGRISGAIQPDEAMLFMGEYINSKPSEKSRPNIVPKTAEVPKGSEVAGSAGGEEEQAATPEGSASPGGGGDEQEQEPVSKVEEALAEMIDSDDEPMEGERMYKLRVRFPDGKVVPKEFGCQRRVSKLFAFCRSAGPGAGKTEQMAFKIMRLAGRAFEELQNNDATFEELGLNLATVSVVFVT